MDWSAISLEIIFGSIKTGIMITAILIPIMIAVELIKETKILDRAASILQPVMRVFNLPKEGALPLLAGFFFGIAYGSGLIISLSKDGNLNKNDMMRIGIFFAFCHGMIEDPLIFAAIGASWWIIIVIRICLAIVITIIICRIPRFSRHKGYK